MMSLFETPTLTSADEDVIGLIDNLRAALRYHLSEPRRWSGQLRRVALARAIRGSNSIEGFHVTIEDAFAALDEEEPLDASDASWAAVRGYRNAMTYVLQLANDEDFHLTTELIRSLHFMLQSYDLQKRPGRWRKGEVFVVDEDKDITVYEGPPHESVPALVEELIDQMNEPDPAPAMVRAAMAHLNLVMIHPFKDGNGRMARCLQTLILAREGVVAPEFCSIEEYLGRNEQDYYDVLTEVGKGAWHPENDAAAWLRFVLVAHYRSALKVRRRSVAAERLWAIADKEITRVGLPERATSALFHTLQGYRVRNAAYRQLEPDLSHNLASRDLAAMVERDLLVPHGEKRGRVYAPVPRLFEESMTVRREIAKAYPVNADPYELVEASRTGGTSLPRRASGLR